MSEPVKDYPPYLDYPKPRRMQTNADRIRAMTDEELACYLEQIRRSWVNPVPMHNCSNCFGEDCNECWIDWLKAEVQENDA